MKYGFWTDLKSVQLEEGDVATWIQAFPLGTYQHPLHGEIKITPDKVQRIAGNIKANVRGQLLDVDYDHKADPAKGSKAAGWVQDAEVRDDGLFVAVQFTPDAKKAIKNGEYRYFSPEFQDKWEDPRGGEHQDVMFGGALTNRPFLKGILPINMSELFSEEEIKVDEFLKELRAKLGLSEDATEDEILAAAEEATAEPEEIEEEDPELEEEDDELEVEDEGELIEASEAVRKLNETVEEQGKIIRKLQEKSRKDDVSMKLKEWTSPTDAAFKFALPPALHGDLQKVMLSEAGSDKLATFVEQLLKTGLVELGERGQQNPLTTGGKSATELFTERVASIQASEKLEYVDAVEKVAAEDNELFEAYRSEALGLTEGV